MVELTEETVAFYECFQGWVDNVCIRTVVMTFITAITLLCVLLSIWRLIKITKTMMSKSLAVLYCLFIQTFILLLYYLFFAFSWLHLTIELLKLTSFGSVSYFFSFATIRLFNLDRRKRRPLVITFAVYYMLVVICFAFSVYPSNLNLGCQNIPWVLFSVLQFIFALVFATVTALILRTLNKRKILTSMKQTHTKPLTVLVIIYGLGSSIVLLYRLFVFVETSLMEISCSKLIKDQGFWFIWIFMMYKLIDLILPTWALMWYFFKTEKPLMHDFSSLANLKDSNSPFDDDNFSEWSSHHMTAPQLIIKSKDPLQINLRQFPDEEFCPESGGFEKTISSL